MFEFYLGQNKHEIKNSWNELSSIEFLKVCELLTMYSINVIDYMQVKIMTIMLLLGIKYKRAKKGSSLHENLYHLTKHVNFMFKLEYENKQAILKLSKKNRELLRANDPDDIESDSLEIKAARKLKRYYVPNLLFNKNHIPELRIKRQIFKGYIFEVKDGITITSLTASQYASALSVIQQYYKEPTNELLCLLTAILYQNDGYSDKKASELAPVFKKLTSSEREAVLYNFCGITKFINEQTKYQLLFNREHVASKNNKYSNGLIDTIYSLSKSGYGDINEMKDANIFEFFDMIINELKESLATMQANKIKLGDIANKTNLTIEQVQSLLP